MRRRISIGWLTIGTIVLLSVLFAAFSRFYTDWLWFKDLKYGFVFSGILWAQIRWGLIGGLIVFAFLFGNFYLAKGRSWVSFWSFIDIEAIRNRSDRFFTWLLAGISAFLAFLFGSSLASQWLVFEQFAHATPFGLSDPIFGRDAGFYVFKLPLWQLLYATAMGTLLVAAVGCFLLYFFNRAVAFGDGQPVIDPQARRHLAALVGALLIVKGFGYRIRLFNLMYSPRGVVAGPSYTDVHADILALKALTVIAIAAGALVLVNLFWRSFRPAIVGVGALVATSVLLGTAYPAFVQQFTVEPNELAKETPYIQNNIRFTRYGFNLDRVKEQEFPAEKNSLTAEQLAQNQGTLSNVRLWDYRPLLDSYNQVQINRAYYTFKDVDIDRYSVDGSYRQVMLAARELDHRLLQPEARTWVNIHLKFTHGYGAVVSPAREVNAEGGPVMWLQNIPVETSVSLKITRPEIYFGEATTDYAIVNARTDEFDYPVGDTNAYTKYKASSGVRLSSPLVRLAFAIRTGDYQLLLSDAVDRNSRILFERAIAARVQKLAPFLVFDSDPYLVIRDDGRLFWMIDAYTVTAGFPYAQPASGSFPYNYIRNSVKATVDAYTGEVKFYLFDATDPLALTYAKIFPQMFAPLSEMPVDLQAHVRYPMDLFNVQMQMYRVYHMQDPTVFYNKEDQYDIPLQTTTIDQKSQEMEPYYVIMRLPGDDHEEFLSILPFTPLNKKNMVAWAAARSEMASYGQIQVFRLPKSETVYGPELVESFINQDPEISQALTLWGQKGSNVIRGNLLVLPIGRSILYVQPLYLQSTGAAVPQLKRIVVATFSDNGPVMAETLEAALNRLFQGAAGVSPAVPPSPGAPPGTPSDLAQRALQLYQDAQDRLRSGDWAGYGDLMRQLGEVLRQLSQGAPLTGPAAGPQLPNP